MKLLFQSICLALIAGSCVTKTHEERAVAPIIANEKFTSPTDEYKLLVIKADSLYKSKNYKQSATEYSAAFKVFGWKGYINDRYNAACAWALAGVPDSAFFNLERITTASSEDFGYTDYEHIANDIDLQSLYSDKRWGALLNTINTNKEKSEANLNKPLAKRLEQIYEYDQKYRLMSDSIKDLYGFYSSQMATIHNRMNENDKTNLTLVKEILDKHGWLGKDIVGEKGNSALFLVIQHADINTQEKYLPMMREAVKKGNAQASQLALLIDRVEMHNNRPQIYGSQLLSRNGGHPQLYKIVDEANVNKRRAEVGLEPIEDYLARMNIEYYHPPEDEKIFKP